MTAGKIYIPCAGQPPVAFNDIGALSSSFVFGEAETVLAPSYGAVSADGAATVEVSFKVGTRWQPLRSLPTMRTVCRQAAEPSHAGSSPNFLQGWGRAAVRRRWWRIPCAQPLAAVRLESSC